MIHSTIGNIGHICVIISFVASLVAAFSYFKATQLDAVLDAGSLSWKRFARSAFFVHGLAVFGVVISLFAIIHSHYYEYNYAYSHSSDSLPAYYMISCFWEGQEGSFLLWIFWHVILGFVLIQTNKNWEAPMMAVFAAVQAFLCSMILGVVFFDYLKIGSSPFILFKEAHPELPVWQIKPDFIPKDGNGLNPLLQNYWMVIHPPTLFLGFATTLVPFAYCVAGLWQKKYSEWVRPAMPWALFSAAILGVGIMMGAYWAYETLNFGGYWNWDPVENAVYVPWLVLVAAIHTMIIYKNKAGESNNSSGGSLKTAIILTISTFILILYATFLTRSGVLGNASVHSFTDLGLSGQLLIYLTFFTLISIFLCFINWKRIPSSEKEMKIYSREFWIFIGATILCLSAFQVIVFTSIPAIKAFIEAFGFVSNLAPPADQIGFNNKFQIWFATCIAILSVIGQFMFWQRMDKDKLWSALVIPVVLATLVSLSVIALAGLKSWTFIPFLWAGVFSLAGNGKILIKLFKNNIKIAGGAVSHIGIALVLLGILFSAGYSKVVSLNPTGMLYSKEKFFTDNDSKETKENTLLWINQPTKIDNYYVTYRGKRAEAREIPGYIKKDILFPTDIEYKSVAKTDIIQNGKTYYKTGDTLETYPENTYYEVEYRDEKGRVFSLFPRAQVNPQMGLLASPDIRKELGRDVYTHVSSVPDPNGEKLWSETQSFTVAMKDTFFINDYVAILENVEQAKLPGLVLTQNDAAVKANIKILGKESDKVLSPVFVVKDNLIGRLPEISEELGIKITFVNINTKEEKFTFEVNTTQKDYIIMKAVEKPFINLLWLGVIVVTIGFVMAMIRRIAESKKTKKKEEMVAAE